MTEVEFYKKVNGVFSYNGTDDSLTWRVALGNRKIGDVAGTPYRKGEIYVTFLGKKYSKSRLVFLMYNHYLPDRVLRKNQEGGDRPCNLYDPDDNVCKGHPYVKYDYKRCAWVANFELNGLDYPVGEFKSQGRAIAACDDKLAQVKGIISVTPHSTPRYYVRSEEMMARVREMFIFNKTTGVFTAKSNNPHYPPGKKLGDVNTGINDTVMLDGVRYRRKQLIVLMTTGVLPYAVYHKNLNKDDLTPDNLFGDLGGHNCKLYFDWRLDKWRASIHIDGYQKYVGLFDSRLKANDACLKEIKNYRKYQLKIKENSK